jgi:hypothetical protein
MSLLCGQFRLRWANQKNRRTKKHLCDQKKVAKLDSQMRLRSESGRLRQRSCVAVEATKRIVHEPHKKPQTTKTVSKGSLVFSLASTCNLQLPFKPSHQRFFAPWASNGIRHFASWTSHVHSASWAFLAQYASQPVPGCFASAPFLGTHFSGELCQTKKGWVDQPEIHFHIRALSEMDFPIARMLLLLPDHQSPYSNLEKRFDRCELPGLRNCYYGLIE